VNGQTEILS